MSDEPDSLTLRLLRRLDAGIGELRADLADVKHRLTALEIQGAQIVSSEASHYASVALRLDRVDGRLDRIERRLDLVDAGTE